MNFVVRLLLLVCFSIQAIQLPAFEVSQNEIQHFSEKKSQCPVSILFTEAEETEEDEKVFASNPLLLQPCQVNFNTFHSQKFHSLQQEAVTKAYLSARCQSRETPVIIFVCSYRI